MQFCIFRDITCSALASDANGSLWIGTRGGLFLWSQGVLQRIELGVDGGRGTPAVSALHPHGDLGMWVAYDSALACVTEAKVFNAPVIFPLIMLAEDRSGLLWSLRHTLSSPVLLCWNFPKEHLEDLTGGADLPINARSILSDSRGDIWFGGFHRDVHRHRGKEEKVYTITGPDHGGHIMAIAEDLGGQIWIGGDCGLWQVSGDSLRREVLVDGSDFPRVQTLCPDQAGGLWVGTQADGLFHLSPRSMVTLGKEAGLPNEDVWTICQSRDASVWVGTQGGVAHLTDAGSEIFSREQGLGCPLVRSICEDADGQIWVGTETDPAYNQLGGLHRLENGKFVRMGAAEGFPGIDISSLAPTKTGALWIACGSGQDSPGKFVSLWTNGVFINYPARDVRVLFLDSHNALWVSCVSDWNFQRDHLVELLTLPAGYGAGPHGVFHEDEHGALWICSQASGVVRYKDGRGAAVTTTNSLWSDLTLSLLEDDVGRYWFGSHHGIFWAEKAELNEVAAGKRKQLHCVHYGVEDGMRSEEGNGGYSPNACKTRDGRLWFPTTKGVVVVEPRRTLWDDRPVAPQIEELSAEGEILFSNVPRFSAAGQLRLPQAGIRELPAATGGSSQPKPQRRQELRIRPGRGSSLLFRFTAAEFNAPERVRFRIRLKGKDKDWTDIGAQRFARFDSLPPGHYAFQLDAASSHGIWSAAPEEFPFYLTPFFYQTGIFYSICAGALALGGAGIQGYRSKIQRRIARLEREAAVGRERERIARDLHDDLGASLTRIALLSEVARQQPTLEQAHSRIENVASISRDLVDSISELVWATNPKFDDFANLASYFRRYAGELLDPLNIGLEFDSAQDCARLRLNAELRRDLFLVFKEALNNVSKHAHATQVRVSLQICEIGHGAARTLELIMSLSDNGRGFAADTVLEGRGSSMSLIDRSGKSHHGFANMRDRLQKRSGKLEISSAPAKGVTITVTVPLIDHYFVR